MASPLIQVALDSLDFGATVALAEEVAPYVDIFEIGTPCIKYNGINLVKAFRAKFPDKLILVDLKTMDAGEYEAAPFFAAGANICTVLGVSGPATCRGVLRAAEYHGGAVQVELINVANKAECSCLAAELGAHIVGVHTGLDAQAEGHTPFEDLNGIARLGLNIKISVAGGISPSTVQDAVRLGADIIVAGAPIYGAPSPAGAAREIRERANAAGGTA